MAEVCLEGGRGRVDEWRGCNLNNFLIFCGPGLYHPILINTQESIQCSALGSCNSHSRNLIGPTTLLLINLPPFSIANTEMTLHCTKLCVHRITFPTPLPANLGFSLNDNRAGKTKDEIGTGLQHKMFILRNRLGNFMYQASVYGGVLQVRTLASVCFACILSDINLDIS